MQLTEISIDMQGVPVPLLSATSSQSTVTLSNQKWQVCPPPPPHGSATVVSWQKNQRGGFYGFLQVRTKGMYNDIYFNESHVPRGCIIRIGGSYDYSVSREDSRCAYILFEQRQHSEHQSCQSSERKSVQSSERNSRRQSSEHKLVQSSERNSRRQSSERKSGQSYDRKARQSSERKSRQSSERKSRQSYERTSGKSSERKSRLSSDRKSDKHSNYKSYHRSPIQKNRMDIDDRHQRARSP
jgi:hypothetical protein